MSRQIANESKEIIVRKLFESYFLHIRLETQYNSRHKAI
jgi:hypothetical protein